MEKEFLRNRSDVATEYVSFADAKKCRGEAERPLVEAPVETGSKFRMKGKRTKQRRGNDMPGEGFVVAYFSGN